MATGYERARNGADWWSRWMALGSLVVAGITFVWSYLQHEKHPTREQILGLIHQRVASLEQRENQARGQRDQDGRELMTSVRDESRDILEEHQRMLKELQSLKVALNERLEREETQLTAGTQATTENRPQTNGLAIDGGVARDDTDKSAEPAADIATDDSSTPDNAVAMPSETRDEVAAGPRLISERVTLRPSTEDATANALKIPAWAVRSATPAMVDIRSIEFQPQEVIDVGTPLGLDDIPATDLDHLRIVFTPSDNTSSRPGYQGKYAKSLDSTYQLPGRQSRELHVVIVDASHAGFGLQGKLLVHYNDEEPLVIEDYPVIFVAPETSATPSDAGSPE